MVRRAIPKRKSIHEVVGIPDSFAGSFDILLVRKEPTTKASTATGDVMTLVTLTRIIW